MLTCACSMISALGFALARPGLTLTGLDFTLASLGFALAGLGFTFSGFGSALLVTGQQLSRRLTILAFLGLRLHSVAKPDLGLGFEKLGVKVGSLVTMKHLNS